MERRRETSRAVTDRRHCMILFHDQPLPKHAPQAQGPKGRVRRAALDSTAPAAGPDWYRDCNRRATWPPSLRLRRETTKMGMQTLILMAAISFVGFTCGCD